MWKPWFNFIFPFILITLTSAKPNFVIFLVDDLGIADVGCFGNDTIKTPNIDRLAEQGARLRHDVHPDSVCTPNRAALVTGRYPIRSGLASGSGEYRMFLLTSASGGLPQNETTFAEIAADAGYKTGWSKKCLIINGILVQLSVFVCTYVRRKCSLDDCEKGAGNPRGGGGWPGGLLP